MNMYKFGIITEIKEVAHMKYQKRGIAVLVMSSMFLGACNGATISNNNGSQQVAVDSSVAKDYKEEIKNISDASYDDARGKTDAITAYAEKYADEIGSPIEKQDRKLNDLLDTVADGSFTEGSSSNMATNMFESYFLQSSKTTDYKDGSTELALAETYHEAVRSAIRLAEAKKLDDAKTVKAEKAELKNLKKNVAAEAKKLGTVKGDKAYEKLAGKKEETTSQTATTEKAASSDASLEEKKAASKKAEEVVIKQQTPVEKPAPAESQPYHYVSGDVYVNTGKANAGLFLRSGPGTGYSKKLSNSLPNGTELYLLGRQGEWYEVYVGNTNYFGWVHGSYVSSYPPATSSSTSSSSSSSLPSYVNVNTGKSDAGLFLRSGPGTGYSKVISTSLENGTSLEVLDAQNGWYKVYVSSVRATGWVLQAYTN